MSDFLKEAMENAKKAGQRNLKLAKENGIKFYLGKVIISDGLQRLGYSNNSANLEECLSKYKNGDYGKQPKEDVEINERAIAFGYGDVMGEYKVDGRRIWIQTDLNENTTTTIFLPEEW